jgi:hypothetical protein
MSATRRAGFLFIDAIVKTPAWSVHTIEIPGNSGFWSRLQLKRADRHNRKHTSPAILAGGVASTDKSG